MNWSRMLEIILVGGGGFFTLWLMFRMGRAVLNRLGIRTSFKPPPFFVMSTQPDQENPAFQPVPDGQERLATQPERDDINKKIERAPLISPISDSPL